MMCAIAYVILQQQIIKLDGKQSALGIAVGSDRIVRERFRWQLM